MRYQRILTDKQIEYILMNSSLSNVDLADKFNTKPQIIANFKTRVRRLGIDIPKYSIKNSVKNKVKKFTNK